MKPTTKSLLNKEIKKTGECGSEVDGRKWKMKEKEKELKNKLMMITMFRFCKELKN